jgi:hypothetical protein
VEPSHKFVTVEGMYMVDKANETKVSAFDQAWEYEGLEGLHAFAMEHYDLVQSIGVRVSQE